MEISPFPKKINEADSRGYTHWEGEAEKMVPVIVED
jgi:hypothetical protein